MIVSGGGLRVEVCDVNLDASAAASLLRDSRKEGEEDRRSAVTLEAYVPVLVCAICYLAF